MNSILDNNFLDACESGDLARAKQALTQGATLYAVNANDDDALMLASHHKKIDVCRWLLDLQFRNDSTHSARTLFVAAQGDIRVLDLLIQAGFDVNLQDAKGRAALHACAGLTPDRDKVELLLDYGAQIDLRDIGGWTALMFACLRDSRWNEVVSFLIENEADVNHQSADGLTPLLLACKDKMVYDGPFNILLSSERVDVNQPGLRFGWTPLMISVAGRYSLPEIVCILLNRGANVNATMQIQQSATPPIHATTMAENAYKDINVGSEFDGYNALMWAEKKKCSPEIIRLLKES